MPRTIDIDDTLGRASITVEPHETPAEQAERLRMERIEHRFEMTRRYVLFFVFLLLFLLAAAASAYEALLDPTASADTKRWAQTILSSLVSGVASFLVGQALGKKS